MDRQLTAMIAQTPLPQDPGGDIIIQPDLQMWVQI